MPNASSKNLAVFSGSRTEMAMWRSLLAMANSCDWRTCDCWRYINPSRAAGQPPGKRRPLHQMHVEHARHRLDGAGDLRRDLEAARQLDFDLGAAAKLEHHIDLAVALAVQAFGD